MRVSTYYKKIGLILLFISVLLLFSSCISTSSNQERTIFTGTEGIELDFIDSVPDSIYEESSMILGARIQNQGPYTITDDNPGVLSLVSDETYLIFNDTASGKYAFSLLGKSQYYPEGEFAILTLPNVKARKMVGAIQNPESEIYISACYPYKTLLSEPVCIDFDLYNQDQREKACATEDLRISGGQGAPIAITEIKPIMHFEAGAVSPQFFITIENKDDGVSWYNEGKTCLNGNYGSKDWSKVKINGTLSTFELRCKPEIVKLIDNEATIRCVTDGEFIKTSNFLTTLNLQLHYNYIESISKKIDILRMPKDEDYYSIPDVSTCQGKPQGSVCHEDGSMVCNEEGKCENKCSYCARADGQRSNVECGNIVRGFTCSCSDQDKLAIPLAKEEYEDNACRLGLCCNPGLTEFKVEYSDKIGNQFAPFKEMSYDEEFYATTIYRFRPYTTSDTAYYCMLAAYDDKDKLISNTPIDNCKSNSNYIDLDSSEYIDKSITLVSKAYENKGGDIDDYKFSSKPYQVKFIAYKTIGEIISEKIMNISKDDEHISDIEEDECAAFVKRLLRKAYGLGKYDELSTIGLDCLDSQINGKSNDAWDIVACSRADIYYFDAEDPFSAEDVKEELKPGDLVFIMSSKSWCKWSGYNYYHGSGECEITDERTGREGGYCLNNSIIYHPSDNSTPIFCDYSENGMTYHTFPMITHVGIYLGGDNVAYSGSDMHTEGTLNGFINSVHSDGIRVIVKPDYPEIEE